jgi:Uma2 family endonuclease
VGEDSLHTLICELLRPLVERWLVSIGKPAFVGADQFIYYKQFDPHKVIAPDVYVLPGVRRGRRVKSWKTWKTGIAPSFALEVTASDNAEKDYRDAPDRYAELGVDELCIFDVDYELGEDRVRFQRFRNLRKRGFTRVERTNADRIRSRVLGCFLRVVGEGDEARLRLATGGSGDVLFPTAEEAERAEKEAERAAKQEAMAEAQAERAGKEAERAAKEEALRELSELRARLARGEQR